MANYYNEKKHEPTIRASAGDAEVSHPLFVSYADLENVLNNPEIYEDGEWVLLPEKVHGTQCRLGKTDDEQLAGSKDFCSASGR